MRYWKADNHRWGKGHLHLIHPDGDRTLCGVKIANCPGLEIQDGESDCRGCANVVSAEERRRVCEEQWRLERQEWERQEQERRREAERRTQAWCAKYNPQGMKFVPFGQYRGMPLEIMAQDRRYCEWLMEQEWFQERFQALCSSIADW